MKLKFKPWAIGPGVSKLLMIMKLVIAILFITLTQVHASSLAQTVTVHAKNVPIEKVLKKITRQGDYHFIYDSKLEVLQTKTVTIDADHASLKEVLDECLAGLPVTYTIIQQTVAIKGVTPPVQEHSNMTVTGTVTDEKGTPLAGASVRIKDKVLAVTTDINGNFSLTAENGAVLVISYTGYITREITLTGQTSLTVTLKEQVKDLGEVVVVGYGNQRKSDITGAISVVSGKAMESRPNSQFGDLIEGKTAGVQVMSSSGKPSDGFSIRIRGTSSINSNSDALYVVDGVPISDTRSLNPADIESISILKDASSAAIYGAQGANGVVLITTKKGKAGKSVVQFDSYLGSSSVRKELSVLNAEQYKALMIEMGQNTDWSQYTANTNWQDEVFQHGRSQNYQVSISGRNEKTGYYISGGWMGQVGAVRSSEMDRGNFRVNLDQKVKDWFKVGANVAYTRYHDVGLNDNLQVNSGGVILGALTTPPVIGVYNADGTFTRNPFQDWENPLASTDGVKQGYVTQRILGNMFSEINFIPELKWRANIGIDNSNSTYHSFRDPFHTDQGRSNGGISDYNTNLANFWIVENTLTYTKSIQKHNFTALGAVVFQKNNWENSYIERRGFTGDAVTTPNGGATVSNATADISAKANQSYLSRVTYDYDNRYLLTANFRADNSSNFGPGHRWGYFPSFSAGWRISKEQFFKTDFINDLKLRAGWGIVGNDQIGNLAYLAQVGVSATYPIGATTYPGTYPSTIGDSNLKWEQTQQTDIALDVSFLQSRINLTAEVYNKKTTDLLLYLPIPYSTGLNTGIRNVGAVRNNGLELSLNTKNFVNEFKWESDFNISFNRNKILNLVGQQIPGAALSSREDIALNKQGYPLGMFYGYVADKVDPVTGNLFYLDSKGNDTFNPNAATDRVFIGNPNPKFIYGFTNSFSYKSFALTVFLQGTYGNDVFDATRIETEAMEGPKNQSTAVLRRWEQAGDITDIPRSGNSNNSRVSSRFVEDGSYLRVKTATLSYNLPKSLLSKAKIASAKVYVTGENLFTITGYSGYDPEVNFAGANSNTVLGIDYGTFPQTRNLIFGLSVQF